MHMNNKQEHIRQKPAAIIEPEVITAATSRPQGQIIDVKC